MQGPLQQPMFTSQKVGKWCGEMNSHLCVCIFLNELIAAEAVWMRAKNAQPAHFKLFLFFFSASK